MAKTIQIPMSLFGEICSYFLRPSPDADYEADQWDRIHDHLSSTLDATILRGLNTRYRREPTEKEREQTRLAYLTAVCTPETLRPPHALDLFL